MSEDRLSIEELEGLRPTRKNLEHVVERLGYGDDLGYFFEDNEGAVEAVLTWLVDNRGLFDIEGFSQGDRVVLTGDPENGVAEETATVVAYYGGGVYLVEVDGRRTTDDPDGLLEVERMEMRAAEAPTGG